MLIQKVKIKLTVLENAPLFLQNSRLKIVFHKN